MSDSVLPNLPGLLWNKEVEPLFNTRVQKSPSLREIRISFSPKPLRTFKLAYELLRDDVTHNELKQLFGFYLSRAGSFDSFLYADPSDSIATQEQIGVGNSSQTEFQLVRTFNGETELVLNALSATTTVFSNGVEVSDDDYSLSGGVITFDTAPPLGAVITWSGTYYYRCRFEQDQLDFNKFMREFWESREVAFIGSLGDLI
jgi:uncharacterized protein (TIGR02217 family)